MADRTAPIRAKAEGAKAENGDRVTIIFNGKIDGEPFEGGTGEDIQVVIGSNTFIPGFEEQLIGLGAGETRTLKVTFPDELRQREARRQGGRVRDHRDSDRSAGEVEIDDEFAKRSAWNRSTS